MPDPGPKLKGNGSRPAAIFWYPPRHEFALRREVMDLQTRLVGSAGKRVTVISLAECLDAALAARGFDAAQMIELETKVGLKTMANTVTDVLKKERFADLVAARLPHEPDPARDVVFIVRAGALYPVYRTSALLDHLSAALTVPTVLFYPGALDHPSGLCFMGVHTADSSYRTRIF